VTAILGLNAYHGDAVAALLVEGQQISVTIGSPRDDQTRGPSTMVAWSTRMMQTSVPRSHAAELSSSLMREPIWRRVAYGHCGVGCLRNASLSSSTIRLRLGRVQPMCLVEMPS
jgi:hypothetical protein